MSENGVTNWYVCSECEYPTDVARTLLGNYHVGYCQNVDCPRYHQLVELVVRSEDSRLPRNVVVGKENNG